MANYLATLDEYEEFASFQHPDREAIFHYIDLMYNLESPLIKDYQDIAMRKAVAARAAGLDLEQEWMKVIIKGSNPEFNKMVECYVGRIQNNLQFQMLCTAEEYFSELQQLINTKILNKDIGDEKLFSSAKSKGALMEESEVTAGRIENYRKILYPKELGVEVAGIKKRIRPETMTK